MCKFSPQFFEFPKTPNPTAENVHLSVQVNIPAESGEMGVLANHVPSIEQLKPGLIEVIEESGGSKQFFRTCNRDSHTLRGNMG